MARSTASILAEITAIEAMMASAEGLYTTVGADGVSRSINRADLSARLDRLYQQYDRASGNAPMIVRGHVKGLR
jgi:hypothetical protein